MKAPSTLTRLPATEETRVADSSVVVRRDDDPLDVVGAPTITLYVSNGQADESKQAFRSLETVGLAFVVVPAGDRQVRAEWGGRVFGGAAGVEDLAANLRSFRDAVAKLDGPVGDPRLKELAAVRYQRQLHEAGEQFEFIVRGPHR